MKLILGWMGQSMKNAIKPWLMTGSHVDGSYKESKITKHLLTN